MPNKNSCVDCYIIVPLNVTYPQIKRMDGLESDTHADHNQNTTLQTEHHKEIKVVTYSFIFGLYVTAVTSPAVGNPSLTEPSA